MKDNFQKQYDKLLRSLSWQEMRQLLFQELKRDPENHWLITSLSSTYYEDRKYKTALVWSQRALEQCPRCPLVNWDHAGALFANGQIEDAIRIWKSLLKRGITSIASCPCGEGMRWSESLVNDCRYRIADAYHKLGKVKLAKRYYEMHLQYRKPGLPSLYERKKAVARMKELSR